MFPNGSRAHGKALVGATDASVETKKRPGLLASPFLRGNLCGNQT